jgi:hypothetical protein
MGLRSYPNERVCPIDPDFLLINQREQLQSFELSNLLSFPGDSTALIKSPGKLPSLFILS